MRLSSCLLLAAVAFTFSACRKRPDPVVVPPATSGSLSVEFSHAVGALPLELDTRWYKNENGDSFKLDAYKYYISNVSITAADGSVYKEAESYHLIDHAKLPSRKFTLLNVPFGAYTKVRFMIGVDSARNTTGAQTGALDPGLGMIWDWNTGYIMAKLEGSSPQSGNGSGIIAFHIGGFGGKFATQRWVELTLPGGGAAVVAGKTPNVHIRGDVVEWFKTPHLIDFTTTYMVMDHGQAPAKIADNYADMFKIDHID